MIFSAFGNYKKGGASEVSVSYDSDAQIYFDSIGDVPTYTKAAISNRIIAFKANGTWDGMKLFLPFPPTKTMFGGLRDAKTNAVDGTQGYTNTNTVNPAPLYNFPRALNGLNGLNYWGGGTYLTGLLTSSLTTNDTCIATIYQDKEVLNGGYNHGVLTGGLDTLLLQKNSAASKTVTSMGYTNNLATGNAQFLSTIDGGAYIQNIDADNAIWENGIKKDEVSPTTTTLTPKEFLLNGYKTGAANGGGSNNTLGAISIYGSALSDAQIVQETTDWQTFQTEIKRTGTYDFSVMMDGNSHTVYYNSSMMRNINYNLAGLAEVYTSQIGVSGTDLTAMNAARSANLYPKMQSYFGKLYMIVYEATNSIAGGATGATVLSQLETYCAAVKAEAASKGQSVEIIVPTAMNREFIGNDSFILESGLFNTGLIAGSAGSVDHAIQLPEPYTSDRSYYASDALFIAAVRSFAGASPFIDGTHLEDTASGYPVISKVITDYIKIQEGL